MALSDEIGPGLVLHLDPDALERGGGTYTCARALRVRGGHFFLCLSVGPETGVWAPLFTSPGDKKFAISGIGRSGHPKWTAGVFHWHTEQVWTVPHAAIEAAAKAGRDASRPGGRNWLDAALVPAPR